LADPVPGIGIALPVLVPGLSAAFVALLLSRAYAAPLAYIGGSLGTLIGADLLNLDKLQGLGAPIASIGGAGTFDGVFLTGVVAVLIASLSRQRGMPTLFRSRTRPSCNEEQAVAALPGKAGLSGNGYGCYGMPALGRVLHSLPQNSPPIPGDTTPSVPGYVLPPALSAAAREGEHFSTHAQDFGSHHVALPRSDCRRQETPVHRG
jgi:hypothetical protein